MITVEHNVVVNRPVEDVFAFVADCRALKDQLEAGV